MLSEFSCQYEHDAWLAVSASRFAGIDFDDMLLRLALTTLLRGSHATLYIDLHHRSRLVQTNLDHF